MAGKSAARMPRQEGNKGKLPRRKEDLLVLFEQLVGDQVQLEIPETDRDEMRDAMQGRMGGQGGMPPGGPGGGMSGMGRRGGQRPKMPNGLDVWASLQLSPDQGQ